MEEFCAALNPYRNAVFPNHGGTTGNVTVKIITSPDFPLTNGTTVRLTAERQPDIVPVSTTLDRNTNYVMSATFALNGTSPGGYNVVITLPDGEMRTYPQGFRIERGSISSLVVNIIGRKQVRAGQPATYLYQVANLGNTDTSGGTLWVAVPKFMDWHLQNETAFLNRIEAKDYTFLLLRLAPIYANSSESTVLRLTVPDVPTNAHRAFRLGSWFYSASGGISIQSASCELPLLTLNSDDLRTPCPACLPAWQIMYVAWLAAANEEERHLNYCFSARNLLNALEFQRNSFYLSIATAITLAVLAPPEEAEIITTALTAIKVFTLLEDDPDGAVAQLDGAISKLELALSALRLLPIPGIGALIDDVAQVLNLAGPIRLNMEAYAQAFHNEKNSRAEFSRLNDDFMNKLALYHECQLIDDDCDLTGKLLGESITSNDPNALSGTLGYGQSFWSSGVSPLAYNVFFENMPTASAPAAEVLVTDHLDAMKLDMTTVNLQSITFANQTVTPTLDVSLPVGMRQFNADVDLRPAKNLIVRINANVDMLTGDLTWHFLSLDPATMQPTQDPTAGFLDPGQEGSVLFSVLPKNTLPTGTVITDQASIKFDFNAWIDTPSWFNTIDNDKPNSQVNRLAGIQSGLSFRVSWQGQDVGSGLRDFTIYVSDNGGAWTPWLTNTADTSATFTGVGGHTYAFASQSRDNVFNLEGLHPLADTVTQVPNIATDVSSRVSVTRGGFRLNRATGRFVQTVTLKNTGISAIAGPVSLVLDGLSGNATLFNKTGVTSATSPTGSPYLSVSAGNMAAGASVTVTLEFTNSNVSKGITYNTRVLAGTGSR